MYFYQEKFMFFPSKNIKKIESSNITELNIKTDKWNTLNALFLDNNSDKTVLYFHWNWWNIYHLDNMIKVFNDLKLNAYLFDYRSFWKSDSKITSENELYYDNNFIYNYILNTWVKENDIIIWWQSLGWAMAIDTAQNKNIYGLIVQSSFYSMIDMAKSRYPFLPINYLLKYKFESNKKLENIKTKALFMHSKIDETIDFENWIKLFNNFTWEKYFLELYWKHNNWYMDSYSEYIKTLKEFLKR